MDTNSELPIEKSIDDMRREVEEIKKELNALIARLASKPTWRDPRVSFPRPSAVSSRLNQPLD